MKNNRGQVLVIFVLLIPVLLMFAGLIIDTGYLYLEKRNMDNNIKDVLKYGLKNSNIEANILKNKLENQLRENIENISFIKIDIDDNSIEIKTKKFRKSIFTIIFSESEYEISSNYCGYLNNEKLVIRKV